MIFISSLVGDINAEPSHWYEDVDVYSISDLVGVSIDRFENCLNIVLKEIVFVWHIIFFHKFQWHTVHF